MSKYFPNLYEKQKHRKEAPARSFLRGSITIEASVVFPLILFLLAFCLFFLQIITLQVQVQRVLDETGEQLAVLCSAHDVTKEEMIVLCEGRLLSEVENRTFVLGDGLGFVFADSEVETDNYVRLIVDYTVEFPFRIFGKLSFHQHQMAICRKWTGFDPTEIGGGGDYVYITEYGSVYHTMRTCAYLQPSIIAVVRDDVSSYRNESGKRYSACATCGSKNAHAQTVYITDYGTTYHTSLSCSGLKRTIYKVKRSDVGGMDACTKCGGGL